MRKIIGILLVAVVFTGSAFRTLIKDDTFQVDTGKSNVLWTGKNVAGGKHTGELKISAGTLVFNGNQLTGGRFTVDMSSLTVTDLQGDRAVRLAGHLKNEDFFDAPTDYNNASIRQEGNYNYAHQGQYGKGSHLADILQTGDFNNARSVQHGESHMSQIIQTGNGNIANVTQNN